MPLNNIEIMYGYRILAASTETTSEVDAGLRGNEYDGLVYTFPFDWDGNLPLLLSKNLPLKALAVTCPAKLHFPSDISGKMSALEMLLLSDVGGEIRFEGNTLRVLSISFGPSLRFGEMPSLTTLSIDSCTSNAFRDICTKAKNISRLELVGGGCATLDGISDLMGLRSLELSCMNKLRSISVLAQCPRVEELIIYSVRNIEDFYCTLWKLPSLKILRLISCGELPDFDFLENLELNNFVCSRTKVASKTHPALARIKSVYID